MPTSSQIDFLYEDSSWDGNKDAFEKKVTEVLQLVEMELLEIDRPLELSILLADEKKIQSINLEYRGKDKCTNVLSFPAENWIETNNKFYLEQQPIAKELPIFLGDIVLCYAVIKTESEDQGKLIMDHATHMVLHSILHLLGLDHQSESECLHMETLEISLLKQLKIKNPYIINSMDDV